MKDFLEFFENYSIFYLIFYNTTTGGDKMEQYFFSKEQFELLFENNNSVVLYLKKKDNDLKVLYSNKQAKYVFTKKLEGKLLLEDLPISRNQLIEHSKKAIQLKKEIGYEECIYVEMELKKYKVTLIPVMEKDRTFILFFLKEVELEKEIEDKKLFLQSIFNNSFLSTLLFSKEGKLLEANSKFLNDFHLTMDEMKDKDIEHLPFILNEDKIDLKQLLQHICDGNRCPSKQLTFIDHMGKRRNFVASFSPFMACEKTVHSIFIIMQEITEMKQQEHVLKSTSQFLQNYRKALNSAAEVSITNDDGYIIEVNDRFAEQSGYTKEELIGKKPSILNSRYHSKEFFENLWKTIKSGKVWRGEIRNITKYGTYYWNDCTILPLPDEEGNIQRFLAINFNITEKKRMLTELRNIEHMFKMITENTNDLIVLMNEDGIISYVSAAYERKLGYTKEEMVGQFYTKLLSNESKQLWNDELTVLDYTKNRKIELIHKTKNGTEFWTECNFTVVKDYVRNKGAQIIMVAREISERKEFENKLLFLAYHDALTQLPNRRYVINEFPNIIANAEKQKQSVAILYVDGDNFKQVNDRFGHNIGDEFIYQFGKALSKSVRAHDVVARIGGDEFVMILTGLAKNEEKREQQLKRIIQRLRKNLQIGWTIDDHLFTPTASIGVAFYPDHGQTLMELLENSDRALYEIKCSTKNNYKIYDKS